MMKSKLTARLEAALPRKISPFPVPAELPSPQFNFSRAGGFDWPWPTSPPPAPPNGPPYGPSLPTLAGGKFNLPSATGTMDANFQNWQLGGLYGKVASVLGGNQSQGSQVTDYRQMFDIGFVPQGTGSSAPGDWTTPEDPEVQAGQQDSEEPADTNGPAIAADDPDDPDDGRGIPGWSGPFGAAGMPSPEGGGPAGPAALGASQPAAGTISFGRGANSWMTGLTSGMRTGG